MIVKFIKNGEQEDYLRGLPRHPVRLIYGIRVHFVGERTIHVEEKGNWFDLKTAEDVSLRPGDYKKISLGLSMALPNGYEAILAPRSSTFEKYGILQANSIGVIDNSYSGTNDIWKMAVYATRQVEIPKGTRIAQFRIIPSMGQELSLIRNGVTIDASIKDIGEPITFFIECDELGEDRGGFGSTGN